MATYVRLLLLVTGLALVAAVAPNVWAGKPVRDRIDIDVTFHDEFLSEECGFDVTTNQRGHITFREWPDRDSGTVRSTRSASRSRRWRTATRTGSATSGPTTSSSPRTGRSCRSSGSFHSTSPASSKINLATDEVIHEPRHDISGRLEEACATLAA